MPRPPGDNRRFGADAPGGTQRMTEPDPSRPCRRNGRGDALHAVRTGGRGSGADRLGRRPRRVRARLASPAGGASPARPIRCATTPPIGRCFGRCPARSSRRSWHTPVIAPGPNRRCLRQGRRCGIVQVRGIFPIARLAILPGFTILDPAEKAQPRSRPWPERRARPVAPSGDGAGSGHARTRPDTQGPTGPATDPDGRQ